MYNKSRNNFRLLALLSSFWLLLLISPVFVQAQKPIKGRVLDERNKPLKNVTLSIARSTYTTTSLNGEFQITPKENINNVDANMIRLRVNNSDRDYAIRDVKYNQSARYVTIYVQAVRRLSGVIRGLTPGELAGKLVVIQGLNEGNPAISDANGAFKLTVPLAFQLAEKAIIKVDGKVVESSRFHLLNNNTQIEILLEPEAALGRPDAKLNAPNTGKSDTIQVQLLNRQRDPLTRTLVYINGSSQLSDDKGYLRIIAQNWEDTKNIDVTGYKLLSRSLDANGQMGEIILEENSIGDENTDEPDEIIEAEAIAAELLNPDEEGNYEQNFTKITDNIVEDRNEIVRRSRRLTRDLRDLTEKLLQTTNLNPSQRKVLKGYLINLEQALAANDSTFSTYQKEAWTRISKMENLIDEKDSLRFVAEEKIKEMELIYNRLETEKKLAEIKSRDNIILLSSVIFFLSLLAIGFYIYNRIIDRQKKELVKTKNELDDKIEKINLQHEEISSQRSKIDQKNQEIERAYNQIRSSIMSAERIQQAILEEPREFLRHFEGGFVTYYPRDIVSGDFYWFTQRGPEVIIAVVDCTGHGVPGAFMTMLGNSLLDQIVNENAITDPAAILTMMDEKVQTLLHQQERETSRDGMDMSILNINIYQKEVIFAGARQPLYVLHDNSGEPQIRQIDGTSMPIGSSRYKNNLEYQSHKIVLSGGEFLYLQSDGYQDQFGGENPEKVRKFTKRRYRELLLSLYGLNSVEQKKKVEETFQNWKKEYAQTDDVLVMGIQAF